MGAIADRLPESQETPTFAALVADFEAVMGKAPGATTRRGELELRAAMAFADTYCNNPFLGEDGEPTEIPYGARLAVYLIADHAIENGPRRGLASTASGKTSESYFATKGVEATMTEIAEQYLHPFKCWAGF